MDEKLKQAFLDHYKKIEDALNFAIVRQNSVELAYFTGAKEVLDAVLYAAEIKLEE